MKADAEDRRLQEFEPRGMWRVGMAGLVVLLSGCILTTGSKNDATWGIKFVQGFEVSRHVSETKEESSWVHIDQDIVSLWSKDEPKDGAGDDNP